MVHTNDKISGTFQENKNYPIHNWYPYIEGYSYNFIENELNQIENSINTIYDPFGGSGTTSLVASNYGIDSFYSETNPLMQFIAETKVNIVFNFFEEENSSLDELNKVIREIDNNLPVSKFDENIKYDGFEKYFESKVLTELLIIKKIINNCCTKNSSLHLAKLSLASIVVYTSNMVRRADLRYAKEKEKNEINKNVKLNFISKLKQVIQEIKDHGYKLKKSTLLVGEDARNSNINSPVDLVITSPPYLNGTNYIRNTKLELKLLDFVNVEKDLTSLHSKGIIAGINSVSKRNKVPEVLSVVNDYVVNLEKVAYDVRIPMMVSGYFYDMNAVINNLSKLIKKNGYFILDIGDSQFAGVHIPTHDILIDIAESHGFSLYETNILRKRYSHNRMLLSQRVLKFQKL